MESHRIGAFRKGSRRADVHLAVPADVHADVARSHDDPEMHAPGRIDVSVRYFDGRGTRSGSPGFLNRCVAGEGPVLFQDVRVDDAAEGRLTMPLPFQVSAMSFAALKRALPSLRTAVHPPFVQKVSQTAVLRSLPVKSSPKDFFSL